MIDVMYTRERRATDKALYRIAMPLRFIAPLSSSVGASRLVTAHLVTYPVANQPAQTNATAACLVAVDCG